MCTDMGSAVTGVGRHMHGFSELLSALLRSRSRPRSFSDLSKCTLTDPLSMVIGDMPSARGTRAATAGRNSNVDRPIEKDTKGTRSLLDDSLAKSAPHHSPPRSASRARPFRTRPDHAHACDHPQGRRKWAQGARQCGQRGLALACTVASRARHKWVGAGAVKSRLFFRCEVRMAMMQRVPLDPVPPQPGHGTR